MSYRLAELGQRRLTAAFVTLGAAQAGLYALLAFWASPQGRTALAFQLALLAFFFYLTALLVARPLNGRQALTLAIVFGVLFRALLFPEPPLLSDDYFRYLWDGLVQLRGVNPYRYAPVDPALAGIDETLRQGLNHPEVRTIYPPLAQLVFALTASVGGGWLLLKAVWAACDIAIAGLLLKLAPESRRLQAWTLYWWSPLVIIEVAWNAHLDLLGVLPVVLALWLASRGRDRSAWLGLAIAGATLVKYFAAAFLPAAAHQARLVRMLSAFGLAVIVLYLPFLNAGPYVFDGLSTYTTTWRFNDGLFYILSRLAPSVSVARILALIIVTSVVAQSARNRWSLERTAFWVTGVILLVSPTVHPWYLLWMVPLIALRPSRGWLYLTGSALLAYYGLTSYRTEGVWPEPWPVKIVIYGPFLILLTVDAWRGSWLQAAWQTIRLSGGDGNAD